MTKVTPDLSKNHLLAADLRLLCNKVTADAAK